MRFLFEITYLGTLLEHPQVQEFASVEIAREAAILCLQELAELRLVSLPGSVVSLRVVSELGTIVLRGDLTFDPLAPAAREAPGRIALAA